MKIEREFFDPAKGIFLCAEPPVACTFLSAAFSEIVNSFILIEFRNFIVV
jgi:hypothetical protein